MLLVHLERICALPLSVADTSAKYQLALVGCWRCSVLQIHLDFLLVLVIEENRSLEMEVWVSPFLLSVLCIFAKCIVKHWG